MEKYQRKVWRNGTEVAQLSGFDASTSLKSLFVCQNSSARSDTFTQFRRKKETQNFDGENLWLGGLEFSRSSLEIVSRPTARRKSHEHGLPKKLIFKLFALKSSKRKIAASPADHQPSYWLAFIRAEKHQKIIGTCGSIEVPFFLFFFSRQITCWSMSKFLFYK